MTTIYHIPETRHEDDFGQPLHRTMGEELYDTPTVHGPWAVMTAASWKHHRRSARLGVGLGQRYAYNGQHYVKVEG